MLAPAMAAGDAAKLSNEELVRRAQRHRSQAALRELIERHYPWIRCAVSRWARACELGPLDREDAQQQAILAFHEALRAYPRDAGPFEMFLHRVAWFRFRNLVRKLRRHEYHIDRTVRIEDLLTAPCPRCDDPVEQAIEAEWHHYVRVCFSGLDRLARRLWKLRHSGHSLHASAAILGISPDRAKRLYREMFKLLRRQLKDWNTT